MPAGLAGPRLAVVPGSQPEVLEAALALPAGRRSPRGLGSWGYSTCPQGPLVPSKSITASHPPRPCRETLPQGLLSGQPRAATAQARPQTGPVRAPAPWWPMVAHGVPLPEGAQKGLCVQARCLIRAEHTCCPSAHRLLHRRGQAVLAKCRPREPEAHDVELGKKTRSTAGQGPGWDRKRGSAGTQGPTPEPTGPALRQKLRTAWTCPPAGRLLCGLGSPGQRTGALQTALRPRQGAVRASRPPPGPSLGPPRPDTRAPAPQAGPGHSALSRSPPSDPVSRTPWLRVALV